MWKCEHCGKGGNKDFKESCWNCHYGRDGSPPHCDFEEIDPALDAWVREHGMSVLTDFRDYEFRDVFLDLSPERRYRTSVLDLDENRKIKISVYDFMAERQKEFECSLEDLSKTLKEIYEMILKWDAENLEKSKPGERV